MLSVKVWSRSADELIAAANMLKPHVEHFGKTTVPSCWPLIALETMHQGPKTSDAAATQFALEESTAENVPQPHTFFPEIGQ